MGGHACHRRPRCGHALLLIRRGCAPNPTRALNGDPQGPTPRPRGAHCRAPRLRRGCAPNPTRALRHDEFVIERKGKPLAALVSIERLEQMRGIARRHAVEFLQQRRDSSMTDRDAMALANDAKRWARRRQRRR